MTAGMTVVCRYCGESLALNSDGAEARVIGVDPHQQMIEHVRSQHGLAEIVQHGRRLGWLCNLLFFECPTDPERFRENAYLLVRWFQEMPVDGSRDDILSGESEVTG